MAEKTPSKLIKLYDAQKVAARLRIDKLDVELERINQCPKCVEEDSKDVYVVSEINNVSCPVHG